jgi:hydrogenase nickel incorporation protein HypA/HybF
MHEISIVEGLIDIVKETAAQHSLSKVTGIKLCIGTMRQVVPDALKFAFEIVGKGTVAEGAQIFITTIPPKGRCNDCGCEFPVEDYFFICGSCGGSSVIVTEGKELYIESLEGE